VERSRNELFDAAVNAAERAGAGAIEMHRFDLRGIEGIAKLVRELRSSIGSFHGLVNNAGIGTYGVLATMHNSLIQELVRINKVAPIVLTKYVVRHMMADAVVASSISPRLNRLQGHVGLRGN
jgi:3-oxoacyl-[acyl-carrier protein] reductase